MTVSSLAIVTVTSLSVLVSQGASQCIELVPQPPTPACLPAAACREASLVLMSMGAQVASFTISPPHIIIIQPSALTLQAMAFQQDLLQDEQRWA